MGMWIFVAIIRPILGYASVVWFVKLGQQIVHGKLAALQRAVWLGITTTIGTTSGAALDVLLN